jgi:hypothetical protein
LEVCANHWSGRRHSWIREKYHLDPTVDIAHECAKWIEARDGGEVEKGDRWVISLVRMPDGSWTVGRTHIPSEGTEGRDVLVFRLREAREPEPFLVFRMEAEKEKAYLDTLKIIEGGA